MTKNNTNDIEDLLIRLKLDLYDFIYPEMAVSDIKDPEWERAGKVHDWRNYIEEGIKEVWDELTIGAKVVAYFMANKQADREVWD